MELHVLRFQDVMDQLQIKNGLLLLRKHNVQIFVKPLEKLTI